MDQRAHGTTSHQHYRAPHPLPGQDLVIDLKQGVRETRVLTDSRLKQQPAVKTDHCGPIRETTRSAAPFVPTILSDSSSSAYLTSRPVSRRPPFATVRAAPLLALYRECHRAGPTERSLALPGPVLRGPAFAASADFALNKAAGRACPNLGSNFGCSIHADLRGHGLPGCAVVDCFGAGQQVVEVTFSGQDWRRTPEIAASMFAVFSAMRQLKESRRADRRPHRGRHHLRRSGAGRDPRSQRTWGLRRQRYLCHRPEPRNNQPYRGRRSGRPISAHSSRSGPSATAIGPPVGLLYHGAVSTDRHIAGPDD